MERYPSPTLDARMHFSTLQTALKIEQKCKNTKNCQYLGNNWKYGKILKISAIDGTLRRFYKEELLVYYSPLLKQLLVSDIIKKKHVWN